MAETAPTTEPGIEPNALLNLVTGKTLSDLVDVRDSITTNLTEAQAVAEALTQGSSDEVIKALRVILSSETADVEYPALSAFVTRAQPNHKHMPLVIASLQADVPVWLHGEAGSGKSTSGRLAAQALNLAFRSISLGPTTSKSDLLGYRDATGEYQGTGYREIYEGGGVFLFDEVDNAHPSILTILNSSIANGHGEFPDREVVRHATTRFIATANTIGRGATAQYVGRAPIDAATIDRFAYIPMDIDDKLEEALILQTETKDEDIIDISEGEVPDAKEWLAIVRANREAASDLGIRTIISPRAAIYGVRLAAQGIGKVWLSEMLIYKGMKEQDREKLEASARRLTHGIMNKLGVDRPENTATSPEERPAEPLNADIPRSRMASQGYDLEDYVKHCIASNDINKHAFVASMAWQLEKKFGRTFVSDSGTEGLFRADTEIGKRARTVMEFVENVQDTGWAKSFITDQLLRPEMINSVQYQTYFNSFRSRLNSGAGNKTAEGINRLEEEFKAVYGFTPGPYSLAWWYENIRNK